MMGASLVFEGSRDELRPCFSPEGYNLKMFEVIVSCSMIFFLTVGYRQGPDSVFPPERLLYLLKI